MDHKNPAVSAGFLFMLGCFGGDQEFNNSQAAASQRWALAGGHCPSIYGIPLLGSVSFLGIRFRISARASKAISQDLSMNSSPREVELISFLISD
jgi:hypothetical protein